MALNIKNLGKALMNRGGGAVAGGAASALVDRVVPSTINPKIVAVGKIVLGAVAPEIAPKSEFVKYAGAGMAGAGAADLTKELLGYSNTTVSGVGANYPVDEDYVTGVEEDYVTGVDDIEGVGSDEDYVTGVDDIEGVGADESPIGSVDISLE